jgi:formyltetrahydrofolate hydrolase
MFPTLGGRNMKKMRFFLRNNYQIERNTYQKKTRRRQQKHDIWKKQWQTKWQRKWQKKTDKIIIWSTPSVWLQESSKSTQS